MFFPRRVLLGHYIYVSNRPTMLGKTQADCDRSDCYRTGFHVFMETGVDSDAPSLPNAQMQ